MGRFSWGCKSGAGQGRGSRHGAGEMTRVWHAAFAAAPQLHCHTKPGQAEARQQPFTQPYDPGAGPGHCHIPTPHSPTLSSHTTPSFSTHTCRPTCLAAHKAVLLLLRLLHHVRHLVGIVPIRVVPVAQARGRAAASARCADVYIQPRQAASHSRNRASTSGAPATQSSETAKHSPARSEAWCDCTAPAASTLRPGSRRPTRRSWPPPCCRRTACCQWR